MTPATKQTLTACLAIALALAVYGSAAAQNLPSSDLLVPYFEVDPNAAGVTTLFAVGNSTDKPVNVLATVFTNWGIPILKVPFTLQAREIRTVNLRDWFRNGGDPTKLMAAAELDHLKAAASGQRSPKDSLYYSTEVAPDLLVGYVTLRTQGNRPDALWGDWFLVDVSGNLARGDVLVNIDRSVGCAGLCQRHLLRYLSGGGFDGGTEVIIWRETVGQPSPNPEGGIRIQTDATAFSEPGLLIENRLLYLLPVEKVTIAELGLKEPFGALDIESEVETFIAVQHSAENRYSVGLTTYCLPRKQKVGPGIEIMKLTNGADANEAPGPSLPVGGEVTWEYLVRNTGGVELTDIVVTDDQGENVTCPDDTLAPGESMTCTAKGVAEACQYANIGTAIGQPPTGPEVSAADPSHYFGDEGAALSLKILLNGEPAGIAKGPKVKEGSQLNWSFEITNTGNVRLTGIAMEGIAATCPGSQLDPGKSMTCTAKSTALSGDRSISVKATGNGSCSNAAIDGVGYYHAPPEIPPEEPAIELIKYTNGQDANSAPGPSIPVGSPVTWTYKVTNIGKLPLDNVKVSDDKGVVVSCPKTSLAIGESMLCSGSGIAQACQYQNLGTASGTAPTSATVTDTDPSHYFGAAHPSIQVETAVNGNDADSPKGPEIAEGSALSFTYVVKNTGDVALGNVTVTDSKGVVVSCPKTTLNAGESMTCTGSGVAIEGQYSATGTASGKGGCDNQSVSDDDPVHYWGLPPKPGIKIVKLTNGEDANVAPGPSIPVGSTVSWTYQVTNTGEVALSNVKVTDDKGVAVSCPKTTLQPGEAMSCTGSGKAQACQYENLGTASAKTPANATVSDSDLSHYFGVANPAIQIETAVNGDDADTPKGPEVAKDSPVSFTYVVKNTGDVALSNVAVTDSKGVAVSCPKTTLQPGESMTCTASGTAIEGQYSAVGTATGKGGCDQTVSDDDPLHYWGKPQEPGIKIVKLTNGQDANLPPGPSIPVGDKVTWTYEVTNTGQVALSNVKVTDDKGETVICPKTALQPGESMKCTACGKAQACQYVNLGTASGKTPTNQTVTASDLSHYFGVAKPSIKVDLKVNGEDADSPKGPYVTAGSTVNFTYWVKNYGDVALSDIKVTDSKGVAVSCPKTTLQPWESMTCTGSGKAIEGQYSAVATATGKPACGDAVSDDDPVYYYGKPTSNDEGCTPGYWKNHTDSWQGYSPYQKVNSVFSQASLYPSLAYSTLHQALYFSGGSDLTGAAGILLRAATAALLNSAHNGVDYPWITSQVIHDVDAALASKNRDTILSLATALDNDNNLGCPLN